jgi:hypothetical protein
MSHLLPTRDAIVPEPRGQDSIEGGGVLSMPRRHSRNWSECYDHLLLSQLEPPQLDKKRLPSTSRGSGSHMESGEDRFELIQTTCRDRPLALNE